MILFSLSFANPPDAEAVRDAMYEHWLHAATVRDAIIRADLPHAKAEANRWRKMANESTPWAELDGQLGKLEAAGSLTDAADALATLGGQCQQCHTDEERTRSWEPPNPPSDDVMDRHRAGAEWLWAGLISGQKHLWQIGVGTLEIQRDHESPLLLQLDAQVKPAKKARTTEARQQAFADVVKACSACHHAARKQGPPDALGAIMHERRDALEATRAAIAEGRDWRSEARGMKLPDVPIVLTTAWTPWIVEIDGLVDDLVGTTDPKLASVALATLASKCGQCHQAADAGPPAREPDADAMGEPAAELWYALIAGDQDSWSTAVSRQKEPPQGPKVKAVADTLTKP